LVESFRQQDVPDEQMVYLQDAQATTRQVKTAFTTLLAKAREGDFLFVYYCGHGYKSDDERTTWFATYDAGDDTPGWSTDSIVKDIEKYFKGSRLFNGGLLLFGQPRPTGAAAGSESVVCLPDFFVCN